MTTTTLGDPLPDEKGLLPTVDDVLAKKGYEPDPDQGGASVRQCSECCEPTALPERICPSCQLVEIECHGLDVDVRGRVLGGRT